MVAQAARRIEEDRTDWRPAPAADAMLLASIRAGIETYCAATQSCAFDPRNPAVRLHGPSFGADEVNAALECLLTAPLTAGEKVRAFEAEFAGRFGWRHAVMTASGASANLLAIAALANHAASDGLRPGEEVIVSALSRPEAVWPLIRHGLKPVIVDIDRETLNIDPNEIERAIGRKTSAVMITPVCGNPCDMDAITDICELHDLILIEDCCEAHGASFDGRPVGKFGRAGAFGFSYSHPMAALQGGVAVTDDCELAELMRVLCANGRNREAEGSESWNERHPEFDERFPFVNLGYDLRPAELTGAIGLAQLSRHTDSVRIQRENAVWFQQALSRFETIFSFQTELPKAKSACIGFPLILKERAPATALELTAYLDAAGIETRPVNCGNIARQPALRHYEHRAVGNMANADAVMERGFAFGNHQGMDEKARGYIIDCIEAFLRKHGLV